MKKIISVILSVFMAFSFAAGLSVSEAIPDIAVTAYAEESTPIEKQMLPYHYSKLSDSAKSVYLQIRKAAINHEKKLEINKGLDKELISNLADIIFYEDALAFNVQGVSYEMSSRKTVFKFKYAFNTESAEKMMTKMDDVAKKVTSKFTEETSTYSKILYIHDYLTDHTVYDESLNSAHSAYGSMISGKAVCEGYARAFGYICSKAGIKTVNVVGKATDENGHSENHMWNKVYYNKKWYDVDLTWDDPVSNFTENRSYKYFMSGSKMFEASHKPCDTSLTYPESTSDTSMNYYAKKKLVAEDNSSAYSLLASQIAKAAKNGHTVATIKLSNKTAYNNFKNYMENNNSKKIFDVLAAANKKTKISIVTDRYYGYTSDDKMLTVSVYFMMKDTSIDDYFVNPSNLSADDVKFFTDAGISAKSVSKKPLKAA